MAFSVIVRLRVNLREGSFEALVYCLTSEPLSVSLLRSRSPLVFISSPRSGLQPVRDQYCDAADQSQLTCRDPRCPAPSRSPSRAGPRSGGPRPAQPCPRRTRSPGPCNTPAVSHEESRQVLNKQKRLLRTYVTIDLNIVNYRLQVSQMWGYF